MKATGVRGTFKCTERVIAQKGYKSTVLGWHVTLILFLPLLLQNFPELCFYHQNLVPAFNHVKNKTEVTYYINEEEFLAI